MKVVVLKGPAEQLAGTDWLSALWRQIWEQKNRKVGGKVSVVLKTLSEKFVKNKRILSGNILLVW